MLYKKLLSAPLAYLIALGLSSPANADLPAATGWYEMSDTQMINVCAATHGFPQVAGVSSCNGITAAWSSGVFDTKRNRLIIFGGGHSSYYGNELYAVNLNDQTMQRLNDPGLPPGSLDTCDEAIANGTQPNARQNYDGIEYIANADRMFIFSGSLACNNGFFGRETWTFDFTQMKWFRMQPSGTLPEGGPGTMTAYDPFSGLIYLHDKKNLYSYDFANNRYTKLTTSEHGLGYHASATLDPKRKKFIIVGYDDESAGGPRGKVYTIDLGAGSNYQIRTLNTTGGDALINNEYPGLEYDPTLDRIVAWGEDTPNVVYLLNVDTGEWTATTFPGGPQPIVNGTHGRWRYSPASGVFVVVNRVQDNVYTLRLPSNAGAKPSAPENLRLD